MWFNVEANIQIHNGQITAKITETVDNAYVVLDNYFYLKLTNREKDKLSRILLNNLLVAYDRSKLGAFLKAPFHTNDIGTWQKYGNLLRHLYDLLARNDDLKFFTDFEDVESFARNLGQINPRAY